MTKQQTPLKDNVSSLYRTIYLSYNQQHVSQLFITVYALYIIVVIPTECAQVYLNYHIHSDNTCFNQIRISQQPKTTLSYKNSNSCLLLMLLVWSKHVGGHCLYDNVSILVCILLVLLLLYIFD